LDLGKIENWRVTILVTIRVDDAAPREALVVCHQGPVCLSAQR
jgi:hypothetical protein